MTAPSSPSSARAPIVVAIDGPAAAGKSSTAQLVARHLGFRHVDSGALYRAATAAQLRVEPNPLEWTEATVLEQAKHISLVARDTSFAPSINGQDIEAEIRGADVTRQVSRVAQMPAVRQWVNARVQAVATNYDIVVDGRDMGTAVFPNATVKIFLVADSWERARRRLVQRLARLPDDAEIAEETARLVQRDARDATQTAQARDAILIDTTLLTQDQQVHRIAALVDAALSPHPRRELLTGE